MTCIGAHNVIRSTAYHAQRPQIQLILFSGRIIGCLQCDKSANKLKIADFFQTKGMFVVLMKTLYALIQPHSDPCLILSSRYVSVLL